MSVVETQSEIIKEFCEFLEGYEQETVKASAQSPMHLENILNNIPEFGRASSCMSDFCQRLCSIYGTKLSNAEIEPPPKESGFLWHITYTYEGGYSGYQDVFCGHMKCDFITNDIKEAIRLANPSINDTFWSKYAVTLLSDAIANECSEISLRNNVILDDLADNHRELLKGIADGYCVYLKIGYENTKNEFKSIGDKLLYGHYLEIMRSSMIKDQVFIANINAMISRGGMNTTVATWILFNFCIVLYALGCNDVSQTLNDCKAVGMAVPAILCDNNWRNGIYADWFSPMAGSDFSKYVREIRGSMPVRKWSRYGVMKDKYSLGYSLSFSKWGALSWYK